MYKILAKKTKRNAEIIRIVSIYDVDKHLLMFQEHEKFYKGTSKCKTVSAYEEWNRKKTKKYDQDINKDLEDDFMFIWLFMQQLEVVFGLDNVYIQSLGDVFNLFSVFEKGIVQCVRNKDLEEDVEVGIEYYFRGINCLEVKDRYLLVQSMTGRNIVLPWNNFTIIRAPSHIK